MPPRVEDDFSDSEGDGSVSEIETSVLLGIPDGELQDTLDLSDPSVSRIGGFPVFLPSCPLAFSGSQCALCGHPMPLLVQMWCPFERSAMDRALYVWGCERPACQHKDGSIRAWRGLKFNPTYADKLAKQNAREAEKLAKKAADAAREGVEKRSRSINPFTLSASTSTEVFGVGTQLFSADLSLPDRESRIDGEALSAAQSDSEDEDQNDGGHVDVVTVQLASVTLKSPSLSSEWASTPAYKPVYLSTISEYLPPPPKSKIKPESIFGEDVEDDNKAGKNWGLESWENSVDIDATFERFVKRVSNENEQCVRYDLRGIPLAFGSRDTLFSRLWPPSPPAPFTTKPGFAAPITRRNYDPGTIENCGGCGSPRVFECQLMPNLINVLRAQEKNAHNAEDETGGDAQEPLQPEEERKKDIEVKLNAGMEWGTCFIFSCEKDCCDEEEGWKEELVLVQWDE